MLEKTKRYAMIVAVLRGQADRFIPTGYDDEPVSMEESILKASKIKGIKALEFISSDFDDFSVTDCKLLLKKTGLEAMAVIANTFSRRKWKMGSLSNTDDALRKSAIAECIRTVELSNELGCDNVNLWLGSDGFDYPFQIDYGQHWDLLLKSINELVDAYPDKKFALEYKLKEPRNHMTIGTAAKALYIAQKLKKDNLGVLVDFGHALMSKENVAETVAILAKEGKLFGVHLNDAYREWDDDLIPGTINVWDTVEFLYYLDKVGYSGWLSFDVCPVRMNNEEALKLSIENMEILIEMAGKINHGQLKKAQVSLKADASLKVIQDVLRFAVT